MGLLGKYLGAQPAKRPADDVLLVHAMFCMAAADGKIDDDEDEVIRSYTTTLPEFRGMDDRELQRCIDRSVELIREHGRDVKASVRVLADIQSEAVRKKAFVLAVDIAMSSGDIHASEEEMLDELQRVLRIDDDLAQQIIEVIALKYIP